MPTFTLKEGDYLLIGDDVRVYFKDRADRDSLQVGIEAPQNQLVLRSKLYVQHLAILAANGDEQAKARYQVVKKGQEKIWRDNIQRRARRDEQERRIAMGEIKSYNLETISEEAKQC